MLFWRLIAGVMQLTGTLKTPAEPVVEQVRAPAITAEEYAEIVRERKQDEIDRRKRMEFWIGD